MLLPLLPAYGFPYIVKKGGSLTIKMDALGNVFVYGPLSLCPISLQAGSGVVPGSRNVLPTMLICCACMVVLSVPKMQSGQSNQEFGPRSSLLHFGTVK